ncbi:MAG: hypothetical protein ACYTGC_06235 [Planctomycetota bacterium]|jgi:hypothetical protein
MRCLAVLVAALQVVAGAARIDGVVVCLGGECHDEVTLAGVGNCADACGHDEADETDEHDGAFGDEGHCPCADVSLPRLQWRDGTRTVRTDSQAGSPSLPAPSVAWRQPGFAATRCILRPVANPPPGLVIVRATRLQL